MHSRMAFDGYMRGSIDSDVLTQVKLDRARLRALLTMEEFEKVDKLLMISDMDGEHKKRCCGDAEVTVGTEICGRICHSLLYFMFCLNRDVSVFTKDWGWLERVLNLADGRVSLLMRSFEEMDQNISTPLPLPYQHLCKMLTCLFVLTFPMVMNNPEDGILVN